MNAARLESSLRLQRVHKLLSDGQEYSTLQIAIRADVCAVNSCVSELRAQGYEIQCRQICSPQGQRIWLYRMLSSVTEAA